MELKRYSDAAGNVHQVVELELAMVLDRVTGEPIRRGFIARNDAVMTLQQALQLLAVSDPGRAVLVKLTAAVSAKI